ncbi:8-amino-7-oxononanoate synthase [Flavobacterium noncentrifugens]|uniref:8-amino-7-oxononanoate synthase n=1 Tax=Flavobacterium noncentrifugens TaxID=1128970 RepID=UPI000B84C909|nr:8-amino-7-oxononanoate synthase [Flavobacterium noncentrifugens]
MNTSLSYQIYDSASQLPSEWDSISDTVFLQRAYLELLEKSAPENMKSFFIGLFADEKLSGVALSQFINLKTVESFGDRDQCFKTKIRNLVFKNFSSNVLFIGNNMLTGQNAFAFSDAISESEGLHLLHNAAAEIKKTVHTKCSKVHLMVWKDFTSEQISKCNTAEFDAFYKFSTQPNMVFDIRKSWFSFDNYIEDLQKKYRDQYKRARKKADGIAKRKLSLEEIKHYNLVINQLYLTVSQNAAFNTFYLPENHFVEFKKLLGDKFLFYGYFDEGKLIGFNTLIKNGCDIDTYFLGYDETCQREKMLYLNMLYDMIAYSVNKGYSRIIFARTALEIKSSVGAKPVEMFGFIKHSNPVLNFFMARFFKYFEPQTIWNERSPFKN